MTEYTEADAVFFKTATDHAERRSKKLLAEVLENDQIELEGGTTLFQDDPDFNAVVVSHINMIREDLLSWLRKGN